jgi:hypothetical protein
MAAQVTAGGNVPNVLPYLDYAHAPAIGLYFIGAQIFGLCSLQGRNISIGNSKKLRFLLILILLQASTYIASTILYLRLALHGNPSAPQHSVIHVLGSTIVWACIGLALLSTKNPIWHPYFGSFVLEFFFENTICTLLGSTMSSLGHYGHVAFMIQLLRVAISLALLINGYLLMKGVRIDTGKDEESQTLLGNQPNCSTVISNKTTMYGSVSTDADDSDSDSDSDDDDDDKEVKKQQRKRLEEQGGWLNYLKDFSIFLPYLWPKDNKKIQFCLVILAVDVVADRFLNILIPRQIGTITNKLTMDTGIMPWTDLMLWMLYEWLGSFAGFGMFVSYARTVAENYTYQRMANLSFSHVMDLSMDFQSNKDSGEVIKSVDQAQSLNDLLELLMFDVLPIFLDLTVAIWYVPYLFGPYMGFILLVLGITYVWSGVTLTAWAQPKRRKFMEKSRAENSTYTKLN